MGLGQTYCVAYVSVILCRRHSRFVSDVVHGVTHVSDVTEYHIDVDDHYCTRQDDVDVENFRGASCDTTQVN